MASHDGEVHKWWVLGCTWGRVWSSPLVWPMAPRQAPTTSVVSILRNVLVSQVFLFPWLALWLHDARPWSAVHQRPVIPSPLGLSKVKPSTGVGAPLPRPLAVSHRTDDQPGSMVIGAPVIDPIRQSQSGALPWQPQPDVTAAKGSIASSHLASEPLFTGADLLGGSLTISDLNRPAPHPMAQAEQARAIRLGDPFAALPAPWQRPMRAAVNALQSNSRPVTIAPARMVHVPSSRSSRTQQVPVVLQSDGSVDVLHKPADEASIDEIRQWSSRQERPSQGEIQPAVVHLEPIPHQHVSASPEPSGSVDPITGMESRADELTGQ